MVFKAIVSGAIAALRHRGGKPCNGIRRIRPQLKTEMPVEASCSAKRIGYKRRIMDVVNLLRKPGVVTNRDHALRAIQPARTLLTSDLLRIELAGKWPSQHLGQFCYRQQHLDRVAVDKHETRVRVYAAQRV